MRWLQTSCQIRRSTRNVCARSAIRRASSSRPWASSSRRTARRSPRSAQSLSPPSATCSSLRRWTRIASPTSHMPWSNHGEVPSRLSALPSTARRSSRHASQYNRRQANDS